MTPRALLAIPFVLFSCSQSEPTSPSLPDLAPACGAGVSGCALGLTFADGPTLPIARDHHGTIAIRTADRAFLYISGGTDYRRVLKDVLVAPIAADGSLGALSATTTLPEGRAGHGVVSSGGALHLIAGQSAVGTMPTRTFSGAIAVDGTVAAWRDGPTLIAGRFHPAVVQTANAVYVIGGVDERFDATTTVQRIQIAADGSLGAVDTVTALPEPRSHHAAVAHEGRLYIVGGLTGNPNGANHNLSSILRADIASDGTLGAWTEIGTLEAPPATQAGFVYEGALYIAGGLGDDLSYLDSFRRATILADGALAPFEVAPFVLPFGRSHVHQTPILDGHLYTAGGSEDYQKVSARIDVGTFAWGPTVAARRTSGPRSQTARAAAQGKPHCPGVTSLSPQ